MSAGNHLCFLQLFPQKGAPLRRQIWLPSFRLVLTCLVVSIVPAGTRANEPQASATKPKDQKNAVVGYEQSFPALGTLVTFKAFHSEQKVVEAAFELAQQRVHALAAVLTDYDPESETRQLSRRAFEAPVTVSKDLWNVLEASDDWHRRTGGAFRLQPGTTHQFVAQIQACQKTAGEQPDPISTREVRLATHPSGPCSPHDKL